MNLPKLRPAGMISTHLRDLHERVGRLTPQTAPGILTARTTRGVIRRPTRRAVAGDTSAGGVARWA